MMRGRRLAFVSRRGKRVAGRCGACRRGRLLCLRHPGAGPHVGQRVGGVWHRVAHVSRQHGADAVGSPEQLARRVIMPRQLLGVVPRRLRRGSCRRGRRAREQVLGQRGSRWRHTHAAAGTRRVGERPASNAAHRHRSGLETDATADAAPSTVRCDAANGSNGSNTASSVGATLSDTAAKGANRPGNAALAEEVRAGAGGRSAAARGDANGSKPTAGEDGAGPSARGCAKGSKPSANATGAGPSARGCAKGSKPSANATGAGPSARGCAKGSKPSANAVGAGPSARGCAKGSKLFVFKGGCAGNAAAASRASDAANGSMGGCDGVGAGGAGAGAGPPDAVAGARGRGSVTGSTAAEPAAGAAPPGTETGLNLARPSPSAAFADGADTRAAAGRPRVAIGTDAKRPSHTAWLK
eukprot:364694-Chlamydomonas_euryale.AAC.9